MSIQNIMLMEAELKLAQTPATTATRGERAMLIREIRSLDAQKNVSPYDLYEPLKENMPNMYEFAKYIVDNLR